MREAKRVLVTGATGFIGRHSLPHLLARGYEVHALARGPHPELPPVEMAEQKDEADAVCWHSADLLHFTQAAQVVREIAPTHLLHFAWDVTPGKFWSAPDNLRWVSASLELLRAFAGQGGKRAVMAGTCAEYAWGEGCYCIEESTPCAPSTLYGVAKHAVQQVSAFYASETGIEVAWGRIFFLYGPGEPLGRLVPSVIRALLRGEPAPTTHGAQIRDFMHVEDVAAAFVALLDSAVTGPVNIASGVPISVKDLVLRIAAQLQGVHLLRLGAIAPPPNDPALLVADVRRLTSSVGFAPRYDLDSGLEHTIAWWRSALPRLAR